MTSEHHAHPEREWRDAVLSTIAGRPDRPVKIRGLARELRIPDDQYSSFRSFVRDLLRDGTLQLGPARTLQAPRTPGKLVGTFRATRRGFGFVERPGFPDLYVPHDATGGAFDGDTVRIRLVKAARRDTGPRAEVVEILERAPLRWVGVLERAGAAFRVQPRGRGILPEVRVPLHSVGDALPGELVVVEPETRNLHLATVRGGVVERLGPCWDAGAQILAVVRRTSLPDEFSDGALEAAARLADEFDADRLASEPPADREDLRALTTITIDPRDARDFDDAISVEPLDDGRVRLGVHIADVAHFVPTNGAIDREARRRGTSVYFPGLVLPMLPTALSNGVCSLQPGRPRLTKSVLITYDRRGEVVESRLARSLICSSARLTYEEVTAFLENALPMPPAVATVLRRADTLARRIRERRLRQGMISLTVPEVRIEVAPSGHVIDARPEDTSFSHTIIEMFMVEANEVVARTLLEAGLRPLRRVHAPPAPEAAAGLAALGPVLGHAPPRVLSREAIQALLDEVRGRPEEQTVNFLLLRSLSLAEYSAVEAGHFALASDAYCHFTSPIRRYPDLTVHRLVDRLLDAGHPGGEAGGRAARRRRRELAEEEGEAVDALGELGRKMSALERRAQQAERQAKAALLLNFMREKVGQDFDAIVTGVTSIGAFVQVQPHMAEGLVHLADLGRDDWDFDRDASVLVGRRTRRLVHVGLRFRVRVAAVNEAAEELVLVPADRGPVGMPLDVARVDRHERRRKGIRSRRRD
ncbi:MAG: VacB/RNase II family 3'-5' exoribonuclease [Phycisphaerales bacterium]|nr:VacB/RNase II family 3'-5' exoribonuclease [Phycisphaerales bacterium]